MHKILGSWSGMRKDLEQEMLAESLRGRVRYNSTSFPGMDGCRLFEIYLDGALAKRFAWERRSGPIPTAPWNIGPNFGRP